jgi:hypothetical protein
MTDTRQEIDARNADNHGVIANNIVERSRVANDVLGPIILASLMSTTSVAGSSPQTASCTSAMPRETSIDDLLSDPMMSAVWRADAITEADVRNLVSEITGRLKDRDRLHHQLMARCA